MQAAAKLATQGFEVMPRVIKAGSDGVYDLSWPKQAGKELVEGWFCSQASPELVTSQKLEAWGTKGKNEMKRQTTHDAVTCYNRVLETAYAVAANASALQPV